MIYRCSIQVISRSQGRSAIAAAAYRSGEKIYSEYTGETIDYTRKQYIEHSEIQLPPEAPAEFKNRGTLWNSVENCDKSKDARLAREILVCLPVELSLDQQIELMREFVGNHFVTRGMCADWNLHNPPVMDDLHRPIDKTGMPAKSISEFQYINPHGHILSPMRALNESGQWMPKSQTEYQCINPETGEVKGLTAEELKSEKYRHFQKQYRYYNGDKQVWMIKEEAESLGLERVNKYPKTTPHGRENPKSKYWNSRDFVLYCRKAWETECNKALEKAGIKDRVDCRSYEEQGIEKIPTEHMGPSATHMQRKSRRLNSGDWSNPDIIQTEIAKINEEINKYNRILDSLAKKIETKEKEIKTKPIPERLREIKNQLIIVRTNRKKLTNALLVSSESLESVQSRLDTYDETVQDINNKEISLKRLIADGKERLSQLSPHKSLYKSIEKEIKENEESLIILDKRKKEIQTTYGYSDLKAYETDQKELQRCTEELHGIEAKITDLSEIDEDLRKEYQELKDTLNDVDCDYDVDDYDIDEVASYVSYEISSISGFIYRQFDNNKKRKRR